MTPIPLLDHRKQLTAHGKDLLRLCEIDFATMMDTQRQPCGAFLFGMTYAYGKAQRLKPSDVHALIIGVLVDVLHYTTEQATAFSFKLVHATSGGPKNTLKAIIHRGIEGHRQLTAGDQAALRQSLSAIFETSKEPQVVQSN